MVAVPDWRVVTRLNGRAFLDSLPERAEAKGLPFSELPRMTQE